MHNSLLQIVAISYNSARRTDLSAAVMRHSVPTSSEKVSITQVKIAFKSRSEGRKKFDGDNVEN